MARQGAREPISSVTGGVHIQLSLWGIVVLCISLVAATGALSCFLIARARPASAPAINPVIADTTGPGSAVGDSAEADPPPPAEVSPWGELIARDIELEQPSEYIADTSEIDDNKPFLWTFNGMEPEQVRAFLISCGVASNQVRRALAPPLLSNTAPSTVIRPDAELIYSLSPEARGQLYTWLARDPANAEIHSPVCFIRRTFEEEFGQNQRNLAAYNDIRKLIYHHDQAEYFSDSKTVLRALPNQEQRLELVKALSRQPAVMARLRIRPNTDIDKLLGYWSHGTQEKDVRPLLESVKRLPNGGSVSLLYLLPRFARERLYTYPLPGHPDDPAMDCHWSAMNFFNETPDNRFSDLRFTSSFVASNYYRVAMPGRYGDLVVLVNEKEQALHSAVYLADGLIFTKNGNNFARPWMIMRLKDLAPIYCVAGPVRAIYCRSKNW